MGGYWERAALSRRTEFSFPHVKFGVSFSYVNGGAEDIAYGEHGIWDEELELRVINL